MNALLLILLLLIINANVNTAASGRIHLRGRRAKSSKFYEPQRRNVDATEEDSIICQCQETDISLVGTKWNLTHFAWHGDPDEGEETLHPVNHTRERRGMTLLLEENGTSGTCGNNICWGVSEEIAYNNTSSANNNTSSSNKIYWVHDLARTRMVSTPQEEAYAAMLTRSPYIYNTCVDNCTNHTKLQFLQVDIDDDDNLVPGICMAEYDQMVPLLF